MIIFYDYEFNLLLIEPRVISWSLEKHFNGIGTFTANLPLSSPATGLVMQKDHLVCRAGDEFAVITGKQIGEELCIYGRTPNWLLSKRVLLPYSEKIMNTGDFVKEKFENKFSDCESVFFGEEILGETHTFSQRLPKPLSTAVFDALSADGLGNELVYDKENKKWIFNILKGEDRLLMVSESNKNAAMLTMIENISDSANLCYFEADDGYTYVGGEKAGLYRFETYTTSDENEAKQALIDGKKESTARVNATGLKYKKDYELGDTVRVQIIKGGYKKAMRKKITGVEMSFSMNGYTEKPIFET